MSQNFREINNKVIKYFTIYFVITFLFFLLGPIHWLENEYITDILFYFLIGAYFIAFYLGGVRTKKIGLKLEQSSYYIDHSEKVLKYLKYSIYINLVLTILNALQYSYTTSLTQLFNKTLEAFSNPALVYYDKLKQMQDSSGTSLITLVTVFLSPVQFTTQYLSLYYLKKLPLIQKIVVIFTLLIEAFRWLSIGTNKGLFDIAFLVGSVFLVKILRTKYFRIYKVDIKTRRRNRRMFWFVVILVILALSFFSYTMSSRVTASVDDLFQEFPYSLTPEFMRVLIARADRYITQGYHHMRLILHYCDWTPLFGIGNSRYLISIVERITGLDIMALTYPGKLESVGIGVDAYANWHTAFVWFANDLSFIGVILLMYGVGRLFSKLLFESVTGENPISMTLLYMVICGLINISCTNYTLAFSNMCMGFWGLFLIRAITKHTHIALGGKQLF